MTAATDYYKVWKELCESGLVGKTRVILKKVEV